MWVCPQIKLKPHIPVIAVDMFPSILAILSRAEAFSMTYFGSVAVLWPCPAEEGRRYWEQPHYKSPMKSEGEKENDTRRTKRILL